MTRAFLSSLAVLAACCAAAAPVSASPEIAIERVVVVTSEDQRPMSGVSIGAGGLIATLGRGGEADRLRVRLHDGRELPAERLGHDPATNIAILKVDEELSAFQVARPPELGAPSCVIGDALGLGLAVSCGVVSARDVSGVGLSPVEDFLMTDAPAPPGVEGGALVDRDGRLLGMVAGALRAEDGPAARVAISAPLLLRVVRDLKERGRVDYVSAGWRLGPLQPRLLQRIAGAETTEVARGSAAARAGFERGDVILRVGARRIRKPADAAAALAATRPGETVEVDFLRGGRRQSKRLTFNAAPLAVAPAEQPATSAPPQPRLEAGCPHPAAVCANREGVFPIVVGARRASALRVGPDLLATPRRALAGRRDALVLTTETDVLAAVLPSAYPGDLALLRVDGLDPAGLVFDVSSAAPAEQDAALYTIGAGVSGREVRVAPPGALRRGVAENAPLGRLHVTAPAPQGAEGGAVVNAQGRLVGLALGGSDGRFEVAPVQSILAVLALVEDPEADAVQARLGQSYLACEAGLAALRAGPADAAVAPALRESCLDAAVLDQMIEAGRVFFAVGDVEGAVALQDAAVAQVPNSTRARRALAETFENAGRYDALAPHAAWLIEGEPESLAAARHAVRAGVWGGAKRLAKAGLERLEALDPAAAEEARRFIDDPPPAPAAR